MPVSLVKRFKHSLPIITLEACLTKGLIFIYAVITEGYLRIYVCICYHSFRMLRRLICLCKIKDRSEYYSRFKPSCNHLSLKGVDTAIRVEMPNANLSYCVFSLSKILNQDTQPMQPE